MVACKVCGKEQEIISQELGVCLGCIRGRFAEAKKHIDAAHRTAREELGLPVHIPHEKGGLLCDICVNRCVMAKGTIGYCGIRKNESGHIADFGGATLNWYFEVLPDGIQTETRNERVLSVFYGACSYNCLYCHSWYFLDHLKQPNIVTSEELAMQADGRTKGVFFHGGDPTPQITHTIETARIMLKRNRGLRMYFETNGSMRSDLLLQIADIAKQSNGVIKFDLKGCDNDLHYALTGVSNEWAIENFKTLAKMDVGLVASTLLVPGYMDEKEIKDIASFIAKNNKATPFILNAFYPQYYMYDLPCTTAKFAESMKHAAHAQGLADVSIGNRHLLR